MPVDSSYKSRVKTLGCEDNIRELRRGLYQCNICGMTFEYNKDGRNNHKIYHNKLMDSHIKHRTLLTLKECETTLNRANETFKNKPDDLISLQYACIEYVIAAYSRHLIMCAQLGCYDNYSFEQYCAEWVACNIHVFPEDQRSWVVDFFKANNLTLVTLDKCPEFEENLDEADTTLEDTDDFEEPSEEELEVQANIDSMIMDGIVDSSNVTTKESGVKGLSKLLGRIMRVG